jgi:hypothetical protein
MSFVRLPEAVQTLYAELLDQLRAADAEAAVAVGRGSFVSKQIRGRTYWYLQQSEGARKRQIYVGAESPELLDRMRASTEQRAFAVADERQRRDLVAMLAAGGMFRDSAPIATVLGVLADASVFRAGGILIGTQAFTCLANMLGVSFEKESLRTADIDVAHDTAVPIGVAEDQRVELLQRLKAAEPRFFAVPGLDSREPSTSFKVRGRDLRVDFLTPDKSHGKATKPVFLPHLGIAAQPLRGLDYLIDDAVDAAVVARNGIRVNVPSPSRFALHKLWLAAMRPASEAAKAKKDLRQGAQIIEVLLEERPEDIVRAYEALASRRSMLRAVNTKIRSLDDVLSDRIERLLGVR